MTALDVLTTLALSGVGGIVGCAAVLLAWPLWERRKRAIPAQPPGNPGATAAQPSITCPRCGWTSYHLEDIVNGYCGNCHDWTSQPADPEQSAQ